MSDNKMKRGRADRERVSTAERYELEALAKKLALPVPLVRNVAKQVGPMRKNVEAKLREMKRNARG